MSIGKVLKEEREKRNLTLEDVSKGTLIREYYLEKIEADDFGNEFDGFVLSYIKKYAEFLEIDAQPLLTEYKELFKETKVIKRSTNKKLKFIALIFILLFIVGFVFSLGKFKSGTQVTINESISQTETSPKESEIPIQTPQEQTPSQPQNNLQEQSPNYPVILVLKSNGRCWLGMTIDGNYSQRFINQNETLELHAKNYIQIRFGNAKVVTVIYNGKDLGPVSSSETVVELRYTTSGVEKVNFP
ncbi:helix-turn-helix domain-containing protein [Caldisericum exile]|uniref:Xre family transcriptional regulator n=1 Tax=Caldisericum exile (strain DSM 21853 / NBRC 104410 / AZM16c01) TaxID=511051 RepID=A0A7U6GED1_CALEA|nr:helix-turn-helix domain-containing protein [Caldisericum exile]BAL80852.1 putative Xre family transcriptional regulator [Caldisericum exile AZM16c01]